MISGSSSSSSSSFDSEQFKITQRQSWDSVSRGWKEWWETVEIAAQMVSERPNAIASGGLRIFDTTR